MGFEEEELSDACQVIDLETNEWIDVQSFLTKYSYLTPPTQPIQPIQPIKQPKQQTKQPKRPDLATVATISPESLCAKQDDGESTPTSAQTFYFKDAEHQGEALFCDIQLSFEEEQLSDACQIIDPETYEWIDVQSFLTKYGCLPPTQPIQPIQPIQPKQQTKKSSRTSSEWGTAPINAPLHQPTITPTPSLHISPPTKMMRLIT